MVRVRTAATAGNARLIMADILIFSQVVVGFQVCEFSNLNVFDLSLDHEITGSIRLEPRTLTQNHRILTTS